MRGQKDWLDLIANCFRVAIAEGHFRASADPDQFAQDLQGVILAYHFTSRLIGDPLAQKRARNAYEALVREAREPQVRRRKMEGRARHADRKRAS